MMTDPDVLQNPPEEAPEEAPPDPIADLLTSAFNAKTAGACATAAEKGRRTVNWRRYWAAALCLLGDAPPSDIETIAERLREHPPDPVDIETIRGGELRPHLRSLYLEEPKIETVPTPPKPTTAGPWSGALGSGSIRHLARSFADYLAYRSRKISGRALDLGSAAHQILLGGSAVRVVDGARTRSSGAWKLAQQTRDPGVVLVTETEWAHAQQVAGAVKRNPHAADTLAGAEYELDLSWQYQTDAEPVLSYGRVDILAGSILADLKTTARGVDLKSARKMARDWAIQMAYYRQGLRVCRDIEITEARILLVSTEAPYICEVYTLDPADLDRGDLEISKALHRFRRHRDGSGDWLGYSADLFDPSHPRIRTLSAPPWSWNE